MNQSQLNQGLLDFLQASPTPFHAVKAMVEQLLGHGFVRLYEKDEWNLQPGLRYFVTRNDSSIIAFDYGQGEPQQCCFKNQRMDDTVFKRFPGLPGVYHHRFIK